MSMTKKIHLGAVIAAMALVVAGFFWLTKPAQGPTDTPVSTEAERAEVRIQVLDAQGAVVLTEVLVVPVGTSALEATRAVTSVETSGEGELAFVTSLEGITAHAGERQFWELSINGEPSAVGAGSYALQPGDVLSWAIKTY